ncbi:MAG: gamma carbonic anhydrase family protein, partial [Deltaproteobacteria bacterium]|nr:gamma carbonic anhydrase family protein [Deltaproteobacteria bacterium]
GTDLRIGRCVIIGHGAVVHCRSIGDHVLVGSNATVLEEAEIGRYCIVAAGSLVKPGLKVPDYSLVSGVPARVKGKITNKFIERLHAGAKTYKELARKYKIAGL